MYFLFKTINGGKGGVTLNKRYLATHAMSRHLNRAQLTVTESEDGRKFRTPRPRVIPLADACDAVVLNAPTVPVGSAVQRTFFLAQDPYPVWIAVAPVLPVFGYAPAVKAAEGVAGVRCRAILAHRLHFQVKNATSSSVAALGAARVFGQEQRSPVKGDKGVGVIYVT